MCFFLNATSHSTLSRQVAGIVSGWREHVAGLWGQHGLPPRKPVGESIVIPELPRPPSAEEEEEQEKEDAEKTEQAAEGDDGSAAGSDAGTEGKPAKSGKQPKKAEMEVVAEEPAEPEKTADPEKKGTGEAGGDGSDDAEADTSGITAHPHEIKVIVTPHVCAWFCFAVSFDSMRPVSRLAGLGLLCGPKRQLPLRR